MHSEADCRAEEEAGSGQRQPGKTRACIPTYHAARQRRRLQQVCITETDRPISLRVLPRSRGRIKIEHLDQFRIRKRRAFERELTNFASRGTKIGQLVMEVRMACPAKCLRKDSPNVGRMRRLSPLSWVEQSIRRCRNTRKLPFGLRGRCRQLLLSQSSSTANRGTTYHGQAKLVWTNTQPSKIFEVETGVSRGSGCHFANLY